MLGLIMTLASDSKPFKYSNFAAERFFLNLLIIYKWCKEVSRLAQRELKCTKKARKKPFGSLK